MFAMRSCLGMLRGLQPRRKSHIANLGAGALAPELPGLKPRLRLKPPVPIYVASVIIF